MSQTIGFWLDFVGEAQWLGCGLWKRSLINEKGVRPGVGFGHAC